MRSAELGKRGEELAANYLKSRGYQILERNAREFCEIDIVCEREGRICFVEVKTRSGTSFGLPREAVNAARQSRYRKGAAGWLKKKGLMNAACRFDVIEILDGTITHIENAF